MNLYAVIRGVNTLIIPCTGNERGPESCRNLARNVIANLIFLAFTSYTGPSPWEY